MTAARVAAVIFDLGGVVLDSPLHAIARFEREHAIPPGFVNRVVVDSGAGGAQSERHSDHVCRCHHGLDEAGYRRD